MKKLFLLLLGVLTATSMFAAEITEQEALRKAQLFLQGKQFKKLELRRAQKTNEGPAPAYYVFNAANDNGFVIVSGDDRMTEILGYAERGRFDLENAPENVLWWLSQYESAFEALDKHVVLSKRAESIPKEEVTPFITTTWDQQYPYNAQCPTSGGSNCVTGCVATAMAQVMNYTKWPVDAVSAMDSYITTTSKITVPALEATTFDWSAMGDDDVARLMRYCGQSVEMDYGVSGSSASNGKIPYAMTNVFGYDQNVRLVFREGYRDAVWEDMLYEELHAGRPIIYGGQGAYGGHTFILHGYREGLFYVNWGWSGAYDGYFAISALEHKQGDFNARQDAVIGIQKPTGEAAIDMPRITVTSVTVDPNDATVSRSSIDANFEQISGYTIFKSNYSTAKTISVGWAFCKDGDIDFIIYKYNVNFPPGGYSPNIGFKGKLGKGWTDGTYRIVPVYTEDGSTWLYPQGSDFRYIRLKVEGNQMSVKAMQDVTEEEEEPVAFTAMSYSRLYGDANPTFEYTSTGGFYTGKPEITCSATAESPVGEYDIVISNGTVDNSKATFTNGKLTITKAPLTITAKSYTITQGDPLPEIFEVDYEGFKNEETAEVLTTKPTVTTTATATSDPGEYDIVVEGAEAQNYEMAYVKGKLIIEVNTSITDLRIHKPVEVYSLQGIKVAMKAASFDNLPKGVYVVDGKKVVVK